jgi:DNA-binding CsgD family transcriptional regulator
METEDIGTRCFGRSFDELVEPECDSLLDDISTTSLHRAILSGLLAALPTDAAFCYAGSEDGSSQTCGSLWSGGKVEALGSRSLDSLLAAYERADVGGDELREAVTRELGSLQGAARWVRWAAPDAGACPTSLLITFHRHGHCIGVGGISYPTCDARTRKADAIKLSRVAPALSSLVDLHDKCAELKRRVLASQAVSGFQGALCVVNLGAGRITWMHAERSVPRWIAQIMDDEQAIVATATQALAESQAPARVRLPCGRIVQMVDLGTICSFGPGRSVVLALEPARNDALSALSLSRREQEIAGLLVSGYAAINAAAILELSEHTVRTYIRRLYRKLEVSNRADLVRKFVALSSTNGLSPLA